MQTDIQIVMKKTSDIIPYWRNPRRNDKTVNALVDVIKQYGFNVPIVIDKNNVVVKGHARLKCAKKLGLEEVPCIISNASDEDIKADRISDNKIQEMSSWDLAKLEMEFQKIGNMKFERLFKPEALPKIDYSAIQLNEEQDDSESNLASFFDDEDEEQEQSQESPKEHFEHAPVPTPTFEHKESQPIKESKPETESHGKTAKESEESKVCKTICPYCGGMVYVKI